MAQTAIIEAFGGPEQFKLVDRPVGEPGPGEVRISHRACGLNFIDVYQRTGLYPLNLPHALGMEAAGVIEAVGEGVTHLKEGDRAAYAAAPPGAYCEARVMPAAQVCPLPEGVDFETGAAMMLKGMTAEYLLNRTFKVKPGDTILYHAAAGGVGLLVGQWAKHIGATVIGTAGGPEKVALAKAHGFDHVIDYNSQDFVEEVKSLTGGKKCDVVYDSVGKDTFPASLDCLRPFGLFVSFGQSSGPIPPFNLGILSQKGSLYATRPTLFTHAARREDLESMAANLFDVVAKGIVKVEINQRYALKDAAQAHTDLENRKTTGTTILLP